MNNNTSKLLTAALLGYCLWNASNLFTHSGIRFEAYGLLALMIWVVPVLLYVLPQPSRFGGNPYILGMALSISFMSAILELNVLAHVGLALALISLTPFTSALFPWYLSAIGWMPAFSYFGARYFPNALLPLRVMLPMLGSFWAIWILYRRKS